MTDATEPKVPIKRRGRKPKGGKLIENKDINPSCDSQQTQSVIVHMKCFTNEIAKPNDFVYNPNIEYVEPFTYDSYQMCNKISLDEPSVTTPTDTPETVNSDASEYDTKLKSLNMILDKLDINTIKSDCFWCTFPFDTRPFFIPKTVSDTSIQAYGCFCTPECCLAYLLNEHIDESIKMERIFLLNSIYCPICSYTENIKPAVSPHYTLSKYFGNLSIEEFRKLSNTNTRSRYTLVDKPVTLSNPEFCEDHL